MMSYGPSDKKVNMEAVMLQTISVKHDRVNLVRLFIEKGKNVRAFRSTTKYFLQCCSRSSIAIYATNAEPRGN